MKQTLHMCYNYFKIICCCKNSLYCFRFGLVFEIHRSDNYGHYSDVQLVIGGGRKTPDMCQTYVWVEPPAHRRSAGNFPTIKSSPRPGLEPTRWRAEEFQVSDSNRSATGAPCHQYFNIWKNTHVLKYSRRGSASQNQLMYNFFLGLKSFLRCTDKKTFAWR